MDDIDLIIYNATEDLDNQIEKLLKENLNLKKNLDDSNTLKDKWKDLAHEGLDQIREITKEVEEYLQGS